MDGLKKSLMVDSTATDVQLGDKMSDINDTDVEEKVDAEKTVGEKSGDVSSSPETVDENQGNSMPSPEEEEAALRKKYGGMLPRKPPLISKDHERAFFDSADWALGKQGAHAAEKPKGPLEALRPKLQPTPQQQGRSRRPSYASGDGEGIDDAASAATEDANSDQ